MYLRPNLLIHHVILQANIVILAIVLKKIYDSGGLRNESKSGRLRYVHYIRKKSLKHRRSYILGRHENYQYLRLNHCDISNPIKVIAISHNLEYHNIFSIASYKRSAPFLLKTINSFLCCFPLSRSAMWNMVVLAPLLGVSWTFGLFSFNESTIAFQYIFTALNAFQVTTSTIFSYFIPYRLFHWSPLLK